MRRIDLSGKSLDKDWSMQFMDESHYDTLLDEDVAVFKPNGEPLLVLLKRAIDPQLAANAWSALKTVKQTNKNRSTAIGVSGANYMKLDGTLSKTQQVRRNWAVSSDIVGYFDRSTRLPFARSCSWNAKNPEMFQRLVPLLKQSSGLFEKHVPIRYAFQKDYCKRTHSDWIIPETVYTTVTVNKNFRTAAHKDAGDLERGFSNMIVLSHGHWTGANLVLPNWRIAAKLGSTDFIMFDAHEFHGNTQMAKLSSDAIRCSLVCYYRENMVRCKSKEYELQQAKSRKLGQPIYWEQE